MEWKNTGLTHKAIMRTTWDDNRASLWTQGRVVYKQGIGITTVLFNTNTLQNVQGALVHVLTNEMARVMWVRMKTRKKNQGSQSRRTHSYKRCSRMTGAWPHLLTNPWCSESVLYAKSSQLEVLTYPANTKLPGS